MRRESWLLIFYCLLDALYCKHPIALPQGAMIGLQFAILVFPDHTRLFFTVCKEPSWEFPIYKGFIMYHICIGPDKHNF